MRLYKYALNFWNPETNEEFSVVCESESWFDAEKVLLPIYLKGWVRGVHFFAEDGNYLCENQLTVEQFKEKYS